MKVWFLWLWVKCISIVHAKGVKKNTVNILKMIAKNGSDTVYAVLTHEEIVA